MFNLFVASSAALGVCAYVVPQLLAAFAHVAHTLTLAGF